jgi:hypothetical protein
MFTNPEIFKRKKGFATISLGIIYHSIALSQPPSRGTVPLNKPLSFIQVIEEHLEDFLAYLDMNKSMFFQSKNYSPASQEYLTRSSSLKIL